MIYPEHDCDNTGKGEYQTKIATKDGEQTTDDPSCWVAAPPPVPAGNTARSRTSRRRLREVVLGGASCPAF